MQLRSSKIVNYIPQIREYDRISIVNTILFNIMFVFSAFVCGVIVITAYIMTFKI